MSTPCSKIADLPLMVDVEIADSDINYQEEWDDDAATSSAASSMTALLINSPTIDSHTELISSARKLLTSMPSIRSESTKKWRSPASDGEINVSSSTASCSRSLSNDDLSTTMGLLVRAKNRLGIPNYIDFEYESLLPTPSSLNTRWKSRGLVGIREEEHHILSEEVPNSQRQLQKSLGMVSINQKVVSSKINDVKDKLKKLEERRNERVELINLKGKIKRMEQRRKERALSFQGRGVGKENCPPGGRNGDTID